MECRLLGKIRVVINYVHYNANAVLVKGHDKLLELSYAPFAVGGVGRIAPLREVVVFGIVPPVILRREGLFLIILLDRIADGVPYQND